MVPFFSIVIPAHNEENYIKSTLHSIKNQTFQNFETIIVANGCTDGTEETIKKRTNEKLRLLSLPKANVSVARNAGALNAQGEVLLFLDADTMLAPDSLQKIKEEFAEHHAIATTKVNPDLPDKKFKLATIFKNFNHSLNLYQGCSGALVCRKKDFSSVGGYDPELVVREHRKLILKLKELGEFKCINTYVTTSMRRYKKWGLTKAAGFWTKKWFQDKFGDLKNSDYEKIR